MKYEALESAFHWASSGAPFENTAFLNRQTGEVHIQSMNGYTDEELPDDIEDVLVYVAVPHKNDLDLGRDLVIGFVEDFAPQHLNTVLSYFRQLGAYAKFKNLLERESLLDGWYKYEADATQQALLAWAAENGIQVTDIPRAA
jgi:hypothetical protein